MNLAGKTVQHNSTFQDRSLFEWIMLVTHADIPEPNMLLGVLADIAPEEITRSEKNQKLRKCVLWVELTNPHNDKETGPHTKKKKILQFIIS